MTDDSRPVVVTRPAPEGLALARRLADAGRSVVHCPAFTLAGPEDSAATIARIRTSLPADRLIFTSPAAADWAIRLAGPDAFKNNLLLAPGAGTARHLSEAGLEGVVWPRGGGTSEDLLALPELDRVDGLSVAIVAAPGGRGLLHKVLEKKGARVSRITVYRRLPRPPAAEFLDLLDRGQAPVTLISSAGALEHMAGTLKDPRRKRWLAGDFVVSSERLAGLCRELGVRRVTVADGADNGAMVKALEVSGA